MFDHNGFHFKELAGIPVQMIVVKRYGAVGADKVSDGFGELIAGKLGYWRGYDGGIDSRGESVTITSGLLVHPGNSANIDNAVVALRSHRITATSFGQFSGSSVEHVLEALCLSVFVVCDGIGIDSLQVSDPGLAFSLGPGIGFGLDLHAKPGYFSIQGRHPAGLSGLFIGGAYFLAGPERTVQGNRESQEGI